MSITPSAERSTRGILAPIGLPDFSFIRNRIPIADVAQKLGLACHGKIVYCWHPENHAHGDADPSVRVFVKKNKLRCFVCMSTFSTIDLVQDVRHCSLRDAVAWIVARYPNIPQVPKGKHIESRQSWRVTFRVGVSGSRIETLVRSGLWSRLSMAERSIVPVLDILTANESGIAEISYRGLMRYAGLGSQTSVANSVKHLEKLHLLKIRRLHLTRTRRACNVYSLTFDEPLFIELLNHIYRQHRDEIEFSRKQQLERRSSRRKSLGPTNQVPV